MLQIIKRNRKKTGEINLKSIKNFVSGYYLALIENQIVSEDTEEPFFDWVAN